MSSDRKVHTAGLDQTEAVQQNMYQIDHSIGFDHVLEEEDQGQEASNNNIAIRTKDLTKCFLLYDRPSHMLKQQLLGSVARVLGQKPPRYFREYWALKGLSFDIHRGEVVGIIGRNGAGKSTLLQILCGTLTPTSGEVKLCGRVAALLELGAGFNPEFSGRENVYLNGAILGIGREEIDRHFADIEAFADIGEFIDRPVKSYSSGMYVRLAFAVSACIEPDILIVDEALAVGDAKFQAKCFRRFEELVARGTTILLVTHSIEQITRHCDRAILLEGGVVHLEGPPKDVANTYLDLLFGVERKADVVKDGDSQKKGNVERHDTKGATVAAGSGTLRQTGNMKLAGEGAKQTIEDHTQSPDYSVLARRIIMRPEGSFEDRPGYNKDEYRWGSREVEIIDFMATANGVDHVVQFNTGEKALFIAWVRFRIDVYAPIFGLTIKTPDGVTVYGSNSRDFSGGPVTRSAKAGELVRVVFSVDMRIGAGDFLISLGVAQEIGGGDVEPLDRRYDSILIHVARQSRCFGLADLDMRVEIEGEA